MKNFIKFLIVFLLCILLGFWSPWLVADISLADIFNVEEPEQISGLQVYSLLGEMEVFLDGESKGTVTPEDSPLIVDAITPGEKSLRLKRVSEVTNAYWEFSKVITFEQNIDVVVSYALGPEEEFSEGNIITPSLKTDEPYNLIVNTNIENVNLFLEDILFEVVGNQFTQTISLDRQYQLRIQKEGFETIELTLLPESQEDRDALKDYIINVDVQLLYQPLNVE